MVADWEAMFLQTLGSHFIPRGEAPWNEMTPAGCKNHSLPLGDHAILYFLHPNEDGIGKPYSRDTLELVVWWYWWRGPDGRERISPKAEFSYSISISSASIEEWWFLFIIIARWIFPRPSFKGRKKLSSKFFSLYQRDK